MKKTPCAPDEHHKSCPPASQEKGQGRSNLLLNQPGKLQRIIKEKRH